MTLTKADLVESLYTQHNLSKKRATELIESFLEVIKGRLEAGDDVLISGFGKFCVKQKKDRRGRNPATGEEMTLKSRKVITFRCSSVLRDKMNGRL